MDPYLSLNYAIQAIFDKKVNATNAFNVNTDYIERLPQNVNQTEESSWQLASNGLEAYAHIYSYRVDSVHNEMFKMLNCMHRSEDVKNEEENQEGNNPAANLKRKKKFLETNKEKLQLKEFEMGFKIDPLFKQTTTMFSQINAKGLLQYCLEINENIQYVLEGGDEEESKGRRKRRDNQNENDLKSVSSKLTDYSFNSNQKSVVELNSPNRFDKSGDFLNKISVQESCKNMERMINSVASLVNFNEDEAMFEDLNTFRKIKDDRLSTEIKSNKKLKKMVDEVKKTKSVEKEFLTQFVNEVEKSGSTFGSISKKLFTESKVNFTQQLNQINADYDDENKDENDYNLQNMYQHNYNDINENFMDNNDEMDDRSKNSSQLGSYNSQGYNDINKMENYNFNDIRNTNFIDNNDNSLYQNKNIDILYLNNLQLKNHLDNIGKGGAISIPNINYSTNKKSEFWISAKKEELEEIKPAKEQKFFDFNIFNCEKSRANEVEEEIVTNIFIKRKEKGKRSKSKSRNRFEQLNYNRKVLEKYNYDHSMLFSLFTITNKYIIHDKAYENLKNVSDIKKVNVQVQDIQNETQHDMLPENNDYQEYNPDNEAYEDFKINQNLGLETQIPFTQSTQKFTSNNKYNQDYIDRLYKIVDVRKIKARIVEQLSKWESSHNKENKPINKTKKQDKKSEFDDQKMPFNDLVENLKLTDPSMHVNSPNAFVCLLHLCNEKSKFN